ncbi:isochorismate synthase [Flavobacterium sedimenticola]|uniref:isochorismate synthase n=1 Tax=Flavobacterium sedimenticola TaxID=3043286 RepID=A0ABT6XNG5_9FLAO|nr:isochorismate synthase [Flavobacterium sedimenticola]MDI9256629.1 isochorismate synthase [Flavobacterium sedimenticola]
MTDLFLKLITQREQNLPFVLYVKPHSERIVGLFQQNDHLYFLEDFKAKGFVFAPFDGSLIPIIPQNQSEVYVEKIQATDYILSGNPTAVTDEVAKADFEKLVQKGVDAIAAGQFGKVVLSRKEIVPLSQWDLEVMFKKMIALYPSAFRYCFFHPKIGLWMGATPEQLLKVNQKELQTVALAGTQTASESQKVVWHDKEIEEQHFVSEFIIAGLEQEVSAMTVSSPYSAKAGHLWHIKTDITATLKSQKALGKVIAILHPTPAVCGLPKDKAKAFILEHEGYDREYYSGFLGELNIDLATFRTNVSDLYVNLRCMKVRPHAAELFVGCGITQSSIPADEFAETVHKSMTMKKVLN